MALLPLNTNYQNMRQTVIKMGYVCQTCGSSNGNWFYDVESGEPLNWNFRDWETINCETYELTCFSCVAGDMVHTPRHETNVQKKCRNFLARSKNGGICDKCEKICDTESSNSFHYVCTDPSSFEVFACNSVNHSDVENIGNLIQNSNLYCSNCLSKVLMRVHGKKMFPSVYRTIYELVWNETENGMI